MRNAWFHQNWSSIAIAQHQHHAHEPCAVMQVPASTWQYTNSPMYAVFSVTTIMLRDTQCLN